MLQKFFPDQYVKSVHEIDYEQLKKDKIKGLIFDIDNTLVPYFIKKSDKRLISLFDKLKKMGFKISLVSNGKRGRVIKFNEDLKVYAIHRAIKPSTVKLKKAMKMMKTSRETTAMIGDQVFTDIWAGNRLGVTTILVKPISEKDEFITWIKRGIEKKVICAYLKSVKENRKERVYEQRD